MKLLDILTAPWAIEPGKLAEIQAIYATHLRGDKIDLAGVEARLGRPLANEAKRFEVIDGVAVIAVEGVVAKRANMFMEISGGTSMQLIERDLKDALADASVHSIILTIDSPGGTVDGTQTLASAVRQAQAIKPVVALASGTMASAAYWIGSAAQAVYITDGTTNVGSIGVVAKHMDVSAAEKAAGVKTTEIYAGKFKRIASQYETLSQEGRQSIQDAVDYTYGLFVDAVATQRGVSTETVLQNMADGRVFIGQQAIDAGLVDGVSTLGELVQQLNESRRPGGTPFARRAGVAQRAQATPQTGEIDMPITREQLATDAPAVLAAIQAEGMVMERQRAKDVRAQIIPGHEAVIERCLEDGSTPAEAAMAVNAAERNTRAANAKALASEAPQPLPSAPVATVEPTAPQPLTKAELDKRAKAHMAATPGVSYVEAVKHVQAQTA